MLFRSLQCVYCYKNAELKKLKIAIAHAKREYIRVREAQTKSEESTNRDEYWQRSLIRKKERLRKRIATYRSVIEAYEKAAAALENCRKEAVVDLMYIPSKEVAMWYGETVRY